jgi:hypothetical protein
MFLRTFVGGVFAISGLGLSYASAIEPDNFNVTSALEDLGVDVSKIPALQSFSSLQSRSTESSCSAAVSEKLTLIGSDIGWSYANSNLKSSSVRV